LQGVFDSQNLSRFLPTLLLLLTALIYVPLTLYDNIMHVSGQGSACNMLWDMWSSSGVARDSAYTLLGIQFGRQSEVAQPAHKQNSCGWLLAGTPLAAVYPEP
jgi:hypothetical protein